MHSIKLNRVFLFIGLFTTQFYLISSGKPQLSHILLLLCVIIQFKNNFSTVDSIAKNDAFKYFKRFLIYVFFVNFIYFLKFLEDSFLIFPIFLFYNILVFISISSSLLYDSEKVTKIIIYSLTSSLVFLVLFYLFGIGRFDFGFRYNGFFNDPNQMAFWALCSFSIISFLDTKKSFFLIFAFILTLYISVISGSRSVLIGLVFTISGFFINFLTSKYKNKGLYIIILFVLLISLISVLPVITQDNVFIEQYINRIEDTDTDDQLDIRGYNLLSKYPEYLIFGAGQGLDSRFDRTHEIHSTWAGLLFYYGIVGLILFLIFIYKIFLKLSFTEKFILLGPLFYSFSTFGARTPIFFIFLSIAFYKAYYVNNKLLKNS